MTKCGKYLGLPMLSGKSKVETFREFQEKISKRVMGWNEKFISKGNPHENCSIVYSHLFNEFVQTPKGNK